MSPNPSLPARSHGASGAALLCALLLAGCQPIMSAPLQPDRGENRTPDQARGADAVQWPLRFMVHNFDGYCFSTYGCTIRYHFSPPVVADPDDVLKPSSESLGEQYPGILTAGMGPISNFPSPAKVSWRSRDGVAHEAQVDIGEIFKDQLIRHNLARDEISEQGIGPGAIPSIILEVNDRTINVYMRAHISTKALQVPGNRYSDFRDDLIKVHSRTY